MEPSGRVDFAGDHVSKQAGTSAEGCAEGNRIAVALCASGDLPGSVRTYAAAQRQHACRDHDRCASRARGASSGNRQSVVANDFGHSAGGKASNALTLRNTSSV